MGSMRMAAITVLLAVPCAVALPATGPGVPPDDTEWVDSTFTLTLGDGLGAGTLAGSVDIHAVPTAGPDSTPQLRSRCGAQCSAAELRSVYASLDAADRDGFVSDLETAVVALVADHLDGVGGVTVGGIVAQIRTDSLTVASAPSPYNPPVAVAVTGTVTLGLGILAGPTRVQALLDMGAVLALDVPVSAGPGENVTVAFVSADPRVGIAAGRDPATAGETGVLMVSNWDGGEAASTRATLHVARPDVLVPDAEDVRVAVTLDMTHVEMDVLQGVSGTAIDLEIDVVAEVRSLAVGQRVLLPPQLTLPTLSADALRVAYARFPETTAEMDRVEQDLRQQLTVFVQDAGGSASSIDGGFDAASLGLDGIGDPPGAGPPVLITFTAGVHVAPKAPAAAGLTVTTFDLPLDQAFPRIRGYETTYTILLPQGIEVTGASVTGGDLLEQGRDGSGRGLLVFSVTDHAAHVQAQGAVTQDFVVRQFWWAIVLVVALVALPILIGIAVAVRRRRDRRQRPPA